MYNPLSLINPVLMEALLKEPRFFVRQYYERGKTSTDIPLLLTYYHKEDEKDPLRANLHMKLLKDDKYRFLYDSEIGDHHKKLLIAATQPKGFRIYINLLPKKWKASNELRKKLAAYAKKHFQWWPGEGPVNVRLQLQDLYGQLYLLVNWQGHRAEILLDNVEKTDENVL